MVGSMMDLTEKLELVDQLETERSKLATILDTALSAIVVADEQGGISYANPAAQKLHGQPLPHGRGPRIAPAHGTLPSRWHARMSRGDLPLVRSALARRNAHRRWSFWSSGRTARPRHIMVNTRPLGGPRTERSPAPSPSSRTSPSSSTRSRPCARPMTSWKSRCASGPPSSTRPWTRSKSRSPRRPKPRTKLMHQNEVLQKIVNNIPVMLCFFDPEGRVGMINEGFTRVLGYSLEDFRAHDLAELCFPPEIRREAWEHLLMPEPQWRDFFAQTKAGGRIISSWATVQLADGSYVGIGLDLRERTRFEDCLRDNEQRYRTLVEMSPDAISVERSGVIEFANSTAVRLLAAQAAEEIVGRPLLDFIHPDYRKRVDRQFARLRQSRKPMPTTEEKIVRAGRHGAGHRVGRHAHHVREPARQPGRPARHHAAQAGRDQAAGQRHEAPAAGPVARPGPRQHRRQRHGGPDRVLEPRGRADLRLDAAGGPRPDQPRAAQDPLSPEPDRDHRQAPEPGPLERRADPYHPQRRDDRRLQPLGLAARRRTAGPAASS